MGDGTQANSFRQQRIKGWRTLCGGELLVWIGVAIKMGTLGRCRSAHFWSGVDGFGDETIKFKFCIFTQINPHVRIPIQKNLRHISKNK